MAARHVALAAAVVSLLVVTPARFPGYGAARDEFCRSRQLR
jgi:hypothetical protein